MTSSNENIFHVTGPLWGEFTGDRWIALTKTNDVELWCFLWSMPEKKNGWGNNRDAGDLRRHRAHYDVTVMKWGLGPVSLTVFCPQFKFDGKFALPYLCCWPSDRNKVLHMPRQQLSCHVQNFVAITALESRWAWNEISIEFEFRWKNVSETVPGTAWQTFHKPHSTWTRSGKDLALNKRQAFTWNNDDPVHWHIHQGGVSKTLTSS